MPRGERLAIVTNGGGPGVVAADSAAENDVPLAELSPQTLAVLDAALPAQWSRGNPIDIIGDAPPERFAAATAAALADPGVDALLASTRRWRSPRRSRQRERCGARGARQPQSRCSPAWLGDINPNASRAASSTRHGIPNFYTPGERGRGVLLPLRLPAQPARS